MGPHFELLARFLINVRGAQHGVERASETFAHRVKDRPVGGLLREVKAAVHLGHGGMATVSWRTAMLQPGIRRYLKHGTLPQLRVFEASARLGSLTRAAEELHFGQADEAELRLEEAKLLREKIEALLEVGHTHVTQSQVIVLRQ